MTMMMIIATRFLPSLHLVTDPNHCLNHQIRSIDIIIVIVIVTTTPIIIIIIINLLIIIILFRLLIGE